MDVYEPAASSARPAPAVLYIHGGAWLYGGRASDGAYFDEMQSALNERGFVFASIDYGLGSLYAFPTQIQDAACAVRFLRAHADTLGIDPNRIGAWGASFGGTSAALLAMAGTPASWQVGQYLERPSRVQAVVDMSGATDLAGMGRASGVISQVARESLFRVPGSGAAASPVRYVGPTEPPFFIVHGTSDPFVPAAQSQELAQRLREAGSPAQLVLVEGAGHVGMDPRIATQIPAAVDFLSGALAAGRVAS
jgi:acetyl esterase/lipase